MGSLMSSKINTGLPLDFDQRARAVQLEDSVSDDEYATAAEIIFLRDRLAKAIELPAICAWPRCGCSPQTNCFIELFNQGRTDHVASTLDVVHGDSGEERTALKVSTLPLCKCEVGQCTDPNEARRYGYQCRVEKCVGQLT